MSRDGQTRRAVPSSIMPAASVQTPTMLVRSARAAVGVASLALTTLLATGCASNPVPTGTSPASNAAPTRAAAAPVPRTERPLVAIIDGRTSIEAAEIEPSLVEIGGQTALREQIVDARLARRLAASGIAVDKARLEREERLLLETLSDDASRAA